MTHGLHDEKSASRIQKAKPNSREARMAAKAAQRNSANASSNSQANNLSKEACVHENQSGERCTACDAHAVTRRS